MRARLNAISSDDRGVTLVETMVGIVLLAIILTALVSVIISSLTAMQQDELRVRATQLAQEELERLRAIEWDCVAFDATDPDYVTTYNGNATATLDATACSDTTIAPDPSPQVRSVDGIDYTVTRHVYWIDDPADDPAVGTDPDPQDYKEFTVDVDWTLRGQTFNYSNTSTRVPTVEEVELTTGPAAMTFRITSFAVDPSTVSIDNDDDTLQDVTVTVETSMVASVVTLVVPGTYGPVVLTDISGTGTRWRTVIPTGTDDFEPGVYDFTVDATGTAGSDSATQQVTFAVTIGTPVVINTPILTPAAPICVAANRKSSVPVTVTTDVDGLSSSDQVTVSWTDQSGSAAAAPVSSTVSGYRFQAVIPVQHRFTNATTTLTISALRIADSTVAQESYSIPVQVQVLGACT